MSGPFVQLENRRFAIEADSSGGPWGKQDRGTVKEGDGDRGLASHQSVARHHRPGGNTLVGGYLGVAQLKGAIRSDGRYLGLSDQGRNQQRTSQCVCNSGL